MTELLLIGALIIAISMVFLLIKVLLKPDGEFASQHIHDSKAMKEKGVHCVLDQDKEMRRKSPYAVGERSNNK